MEEKLVSINGTEIDMTWKANNNLGINLKDNKDVTELAKSALKNGLIEAEGLDDDETMKKISSQSHPVIGTMNYDPDIQSELSALARIARKIFL